MMNIQWAKFETWQDGKRVHCKYLQVVPYKALENFSKALYGETEGTYSARVFRPVMENLWSVLFPRNYLKK